MVGYDGELASEWLPVRTLPCAVSLALRRRPCGVAILSGYLINSWAIPNFFLLLLPGLAGQAGWDYAVDRMGRLGLRRRPARPIRATPSLRHRHATADVADSDLVVWPVKYYSGGACTSESTGVMSRVAGGCTEAEPVKELHGRRDLQRY